MCYCISPPRGRYLHDACYTDEETEVQRREGTFPSFYFTGLPNFYAHKEEQKVRHIWSLPWFWLGGLGETVDRLHSSVSPSVKWGSCILAGQGSVQWPLKWANAIHSVCDP